MFTITDVRITKIEGGEKLRGFASITLDDSFTVGDLRILEGEEGYFVAMPSKRKRDGSYKDVAYPLNNEVRKIIEERVLTAYENATGSRAIPNMDKATIDITQSDVLGVGEFGFVSKANV
jgi:stage V sporulation protein G